MSRITKFSNGVTFVHAAPQGETGFGDSSSRLHQFVAVDSILSTSLGRPKLTEDYYVLT